MARDVSDDIERLSRSVDSIRASVGELAGRAGDTAGDYADRGGRGFRQARDRAGRVAHDLSDQARGGAGILEDAIRDWPLPSIGLAFVIGAVLSSIIIVGGTATTRRR